MARPTRSSLLTINDIEPYSLIRKPGIEKGVGPEGEGAGESLRVKPYARMNEKLPAATALYGR